MTTCTCGLLLAPGHAECQRCTAAMENPCRREYCRVGDEVHAANDPRHDAKRMKARRRRYHSTRRAA